MESSISRRRSSPGISGDHAPTSRQAHKTWQGAVKRGFDVLGSALLILLLSPVLLVAAIAVKLSSPGPVLYFAERVARGGHSRFQMLKFRSMRRAAPGEIEMQSAGVLLKSANHPRITFVGRILRKTSIDELPQLFNVLLGDMSLVGPRPLIPALLSGLSPREQELRSQVRPGITGLFQLRDRVHGETALTMIGHDLEYVENFSLWLDFMILARTIPAVLTGRGAI
jgi:lipopolysaccharide/colanic/teichoic acid biosynthesis glycosyltransferase